MYFVFGRDYRSKLIEELSQSVNIIAAEDVNAKLSRLDKESVEKIYASHEEAVEAIKAKLPQSDLKNAITLFRDKETLRKSLAGLFPQYHFEAVKIKDIGSLKLNFHNGQKKYIIKPVKGFFSIGVRVIDEHTDLKKLQQNIYEEMHNQKSIHPHYFKNDALSKKDFLVEEFVGEGISKLGDFKQNAEIAIDGFYNANGQFTVVGIYHHPFSKHSQFFHLLYYTNAEIFKFFVHKIMDFFNQLPELSKLNLKNFPLHAEFSWWNNTLFPIEVNPLRFGGMGLGDTIYYATGINPYFAFFNNYNINWDDIWLNNHDSFAWVLGYKSTKHPCQFNEAYHLNFMHKLNSHLIQYQPIEKDEDVFSIAYLKSNNPDDFQQILEIDFDQLALDSIAPKKPTKKFTLKPN